MGCPGCLVTLSDTLPEDTIFLGEAAGGQVGQFYDADLSFRMPKTTDPVNAVDPGTPAGLTIDQITILSVSNVPPGLSWEANQLEFDPATQTDGCVKFCGIPLQPGLYEVEVVVSAEVFLITETTSFSFPLQIDPSVSDTEGFTMVNNSGCGEVTVDFSNNIPAGDNEGISYLWDFGNGNTSTAESPPAQVYDEPGVYEVNYQAVVDTIGYLLTSVSVDSLDCSDLFNGPDVEVTLFDPAGEVIYVSEPVNNAQLPVVFNLNLALDTGTYRLEVKDDDFGLGGDDDPCGVIEFDREAGAGAFTQGALKVNLGLFHPVDTIRSADTVRVFPQPAAPNVTGAPATPLCEGEALVLSTDLAGDLQWYRDSLPLVGEVEEVLNVDQAATYWVTYTSDEGCQAVSDPVFITFEPLPVSPVFFNDDNMLAVFDTAALPEVYDLHWYFEGESLGSLVDPFAHCARASGEYVLEVTDLNTGCSSAYSQLVFVDPDGIDCTTSTVAANAAESALWRAWPNPAGREVFLSPPELWTGPVAWRLLDGRGAVMDSGRSPFVEGALRIDLSEFPAGLIFVELQLGNDRQVLKVIK